MVKISIIMPVYNGAQFLENSIRSVDEQTFDDMFAYAFDWMEGRAAWLSEKFAPDYTPSVLIGDADRDGSVTILDATLKDMTDTVTVEGINAAMKAVADESFGYTEEELVSSDIIGMTYGSLFDATQTLAQQCGTHIFEVRVVAWYDNEMSYTCQLIRTLKYLKQFCD